MRISALSIRGRSCSSRIPWESLRVSFGSSTVISTRTMKTLKRMRRTPRTLQKTRSRELGKRGSHEGEDEVGSSHGELAPSYHAPWSQGGISISHPIVL